MVGSRFGSTAYMLRAKLMCRTDALDGVFCFPTLDTLNSRKCLELVTRSPPTVMFAQCMVPPVMLQLGATEDQREAMQNNLQTSVL